jgi:hypothetical protein
MRSRLGHDFSSVRVHDDAQAAASADDIGARAYAFGNHVVFGANGYPLTSAQGQDLLAHELIHVMQQPSTSTGRPSRISAHGDAAEVQARSMRRPSSVTAAAPDTVHRDTAPANKTVPADPSKPMDLFHYKCAAQRTLTIEIFFVPGPAGSVSNQQFQSARTVLDSHGVTLNLSAADPHSLPASMGTSIRSVADLCSYIRLSLLTRRSKGLPVFFAPAPIVAKIEAAGFYVRDLRDDCAVAGEDVPAGPVIVVDTETADEPTLLHELGHAVGRGHETGTFLDPAGMASPKDLRDKINNHQMDRFCNAPF